MSHLSKNLLDLINKGREGRNKGLSTGLPKLDNLISGVQRGWLTVIAGGSGSGLKLFIVLLFFSNFIMQKVFI